METALDITVYTEDDSIPVLEEGASYFIYDNGAWEAVEVVSCEPPQWGWCEVRRYTCNGSYTQPIPQIQVKELDWVLDHDPAFAKYEMMLAEADTMED